MKCVVPPMPGGGVASAPMPGSSPSNVENSTTVAACGKFCTICKDCNFDFAER